MVICWVEGKSEDTTKYLGMEFVFIIAHNVMLLITLILQEIYLVQQLLLKISWYSLDLKESTYILQDCKRLCK